MNDPDHAEATDSRSAIRSPEFWLLFVAALSAGFGVSGWVTIPATTAGLLVSSLPKYVALYPRAIAVGAELAFWATVLASVLSAAVAGIAAHVLGRLTWWLWGL
jgi:hypothetical protein